MVSQGCLTNWPWYGFTLQLIAIGKTTAEAMKNKSWKVFAVSEQPNAHCLAKCITQSVEGDH